MTSTLQKQIFSFPKSLPLLFSQPNRESLQARESKQTNTTKAGNNLFTPSVPKNYQIQSSLALSAPHLSIFHFPGGGLERYCVWQCIYIGLREEVSTWPRCCITVAQAVTDDGTFLNATVPFCLCFKPSLIVNIHGKTL